jgi:hypothetical protein
MRWVRFAQTEATAYTKVVHVSREHVCTFVAQQSAFTAETGERLCKLLGSEIGEVIQSEPIRVVA